MGNGFNLSPVLLAGPFIYNMTPDRLLPVRVFPFNLISLLICIYKYKFIYGVFMGANLVICVALKHSIVTPW